MKRTVKRDRYFAILYGLLILIFVAVLFVSSSVEVFIMAYAVVYILMVVRTLMTPGRRKTRRYLVLAYTAILVVQIVMLERVLYSNAEFDLPLFIFRRVLGISLMFLPILVNRFVATIRYTHYFLPPIKEAAGIRLSELMDSAGAIKRTTSEAREKLCIKNIITLAKDMTRHNSYEYVNSDSLSEEYFKRARESLDDPHIYIVISRTGSPASEFISVFTQKQYNHASLSFDSKLQTCISYNGGERVYPPGLNMELLEFFAKSPDSKIMVYSLPCTAGQKRQILERITKINKEGSAYNVLGLFIYRKRAHKPNILYCSQFVYNMLEDAGLAYFTKPDGKISPTDLIELDYYRKLKFELEITFG